MNVFELPVHEKADVFPMLSEQELLELANNISEVGLLEPLVVQKIDGVPTLIDGRNRRAACKLVHVEPEVEWLNGQDPTAYIYSKNITRRNLTAGQKAMAHALLYPDGNSGERTDLSRNRERLSKTEQNNVSKARALLKYEDLVKQVLADLMKLNKAHEIAVARDQEKEDRDKELAYQQMMMERIRLEKPYLAEAVDEDKETVEGAIKAFRSWLDTEEEAAKNQRRTVLEALYHALLGGRLFSSDGARERLKAVMSDELFVKEVQEWNLDEFDTTQLDAVIDNLKQLRKIL